MCLDKCCVIMSFQISSLLVGWVVEAVHGGDDWETLLPWGTLQSYSSCALMAKPQLLLWNPPWLLKKLNTGFWCGTLCWLLTFILAGDCLIWVCWGFGGFVGLGFFFFASTWQYFSAFCGQSGMRRKTVAVAYVLQLAFPCISDIFPRLYSSSFCTWILIS